MPELMQGDGLWFSNDSLVVLRAEDRIFRVPKSILTARSPVFQFMFEFPQPASNSEGEEMADGEEMIDGSPVIRLHDSGAEVQAFLRATMDTRYVYNHIALPQMIHLIAVISCLHRPKSTCTIYWGSCDSLTNTMWAIYINTPFPT
jgi:hypothetical protein